MNDTFWSFSSSPLVIVLALAALAISIVLALTARRRLASNRRAARLEWLRIAIVALIAFTLLQPERVRITDVEEQPAVVVLSDESDSMQTLDVSIDSSDVITRAAWIDSQIAAPPWNRIAETSLLSLESFGRPTTNRPAEGPTHPPGTDLNDALESTLHNHDGLKAVLLLSDGDWNIGSSPLAAATKYRIRAIPIYTVTTGRDRFLPDLVLESITAPSYGLIDEHIVIPFAIRSHLKTDARITVILSGPAGMTARKTIVVPAGSQHRDSIVLVPDTEGEYAFELSFARHPDELTAANNVRQFRMAIRREILKVLVVDSLPRWEYRYLRNALVRDPGTEVDCLLFHPGMDPGSGLYYLQAFPKTTERLSKYDVVFLGDVGVGDGELSEANVELLRGLIEHQGSGLIFLPGSRGRQFSLQSTPLADLVPVVLDASQPKGQRVTLQSRLHLTQIGRRHLLTMLDPDPERNERIWSNLPGFFWSAPVVKSKPGSETLAVHNALRNEWGRVPLLVIRQFGNGKVLFLGTNGAWRWRRGYEDKYHYRFWSQVVRWMSHKRHLAHNQGIRLFYSPETPRVNEDVIVHATLFDALGFPVSSKSVSATLASPSGREEFINLSASDQRWGTFQGLFRPTEAGAYTITIPHPHGDLHIEKQIDVSQPAIERVGQPARADVMQEIARLSGGSSGSPENIAEIIDEISLLPRNKILENRLRLWSNPVWGSVLLILLCAYWIGRKIAGVV